ncbi:hypothetical protein KEM52_001010, partial [Ascosphaera acerosa]
MDDLYDEFGNYIGGADSEAGTDTESRQGEQPPAQTYNYDFDSEEEGEGPAAAGGQAAAEHDELMDVDDEGPSNAVVLHEDKQYYPSALQVYGEQVETLVEEEDAQPLSQPIIAPVTTKKFSIQESDLPRVHYSREFLADQLNFPEQTRNVALAGHLHHGKTALMDALVLQTHADVGARVARRTGRKRDEQLRYTDTSYVERERGVSVKCAPMSLILPGARSGKSHLLNIIDTPGHADFVDEVVAAARLADGIVLVVDVVEGVQINTEQIIRHAVREDIALTLVVNKMDRLILELKLPPADAYFKLKHVIEEVNAVIERTLPSVSAATATPTSADPSRWRLSPERGNVAFAASDMEWCFTLPSFAQMYAETYAKVDRGEFARRLWGDIFYNPETRRFARRSAATAAGAPTKRAFVHFVLEPIYKLYACALSESPAELRTTLAKLGISLKPSVLRADAKVLLRAVCAEFFGPMSGALVDMVVDHVPSPVANARHYLERYYTGPITTGDDEEVPSQAVRGMLACDADGPLVVHVTKLFSSQDASRFDAFGRVLSGTARPGMSVRVLGEGYSADDEEDMAVATVGETRLANARYTVAVSGVPAGNWVLLSGIDNSVVKTATVVARREAGDEEEAEQMYIFRPLAHVTESVFKVAVEPVNPSELPKMLDGLRKINKTYPLASTKVEESGEHIVLGTGELYMDCVLHDLRRVFAEMDIKVSDPVTRFCETVAETSAIMAYAITPNRKNKISVVAEPLDDGVAEDIERGRVRIRDPIRTVARFFEDNYDWDKLAARSIWAFGPEEMGPNVLVDDTLPSQVDKKVLGTVRESIPLTL